MEQSIDWNKDTADGMVSIGSHSLYIRAAGPVRSSGKPAVIGITGLGDSSVSWSSLMRHIAAFARIYVYDRTGLGKSEVPEDFSAESKNYVLIAKELKRLLVTTRIEPPYLLAMHSMGGIPGRLFMDMYPQDVAGMVFLDTVTENNYKTTPNGLPGVLRSMFDGLDMSFLWTERKTGMTEQELKDTLANEGYREDSRSVETKARQELSGLFEAMNLITSSDLLAETRQFETTPVGDKPVSVVKGDAPGEWRRTFEMALAANRGTEKERELVRNYLATADKTQLWLQFQQLRLSRNSRMVEARNSWHNIHWYQPDIAAREVEWCLEQFKQLKLNKLM